MYIASIKVTFETTDQKILDTLHIPESKLEDFYKELLSTDGISEAVVVQTCNRFEIYYSGDDEDTGKAQMRKFMMERYGASMSEYIISERYLETLDHLFRVVSSIDSLMVGENQILAQMKEALEYASKNNHTGRVLEPIFQRALYVGKRVRSETDISRGKVSISSAAVDLANKHNPLSGKNVMIIGTGNMASLLADYICQFQLNSIVTVGRTPENIQRFCDKYKSTHMPFSDVKLGMEKADVIFTATSCPHVLITKELVESAVKDRTKPLTLIDIAMPSDIDPRVRELDNTQYFSIQDLREISEKNKLARQEEVVRSETIIEEELSRFKMKLENLHIETFLSSLNRYTEEIRARELEKSLRRIDDLDPKTQKIMDDLSRSLMKKLMHNLLLHIKDNPQSQNQMENFTQLFTGNGNGHPGGHPPAQEHPHAGGHPYAMKKPTGHSNDDKKQEDE